MNLRKTRWLILLMAIVLVLGALAGCGGSTDPNGNGDDPGNGNGDPGGNDPGGEDLGEEFDMDDFYQLEFNGTESYKVELWQKVDGEETTGWIAVTVSEGDDEESYTLEYEGVFGDHEFSETKEISTSLSGMTFPLKIVLVEAVSSYRYSTIWTLVNYPILENFEGYDLNRVGQKFENPLFGFEVEAVGYKTYGGQEGLTLRAETASYYYEVCLSADVPFNLYVHQIDRQYDEEYKATLVEFTD